MIYSILLRIKPEQSINILYELYRIIDKAKDGLYIITFPDSNLSNEEEIILNNILTDINLKGRISENEFLNQILGELNTFQENSLPKILKIDEKLGQTKLDEIYNPRPTRDNIKRLLWFSIAACLVSIVYIVNLNQKKTKSIANLNSSIAIKDNYIAHNLSNREKEFIHDTIIKYSDKYRIVKDTNEVFNYKRKIDSQYNAISFHQNRAKINESLYKSSLYLIQNIYKNDDSIINSLIIKQARYREKCDSSILMQNKINNMLLDEIDRYKKKRFPWYNFPLP